MLSAARGAIEAQLRFPFPPGASTPMNNDMRAAAMVVVTMIAALICVDLLLIQYYR